MLIVNYMIKLWNPQQSRFYETFYSNLWNVSLDILQKWGCAEQLFLFWYESLVSAACFLLQRTYETGTRDWIRSVTLQCNNLDPNLGPKRWLFQIFWGATENPHTVIATKDFFLDYLLAKSAPKQWSASRFFHGHCRQNEIAFSLAKIVCSLLWAHP